MDEFFEKENLEEQPVAPSDDQIPNEEPKGEDENFTPQNKIEYTPVTPINDYKPMNKGLKVFALVLALIIVLTGGCTVGYFLGRTKSNNTGNQGVKVDLAAKPANTDEMTAGQVYEKVNDSVVGIIVYNAKGDAAEASGVFYSEDGYIVTNDHIYDGIGAPKFKVYTSNGKEYNAEYIAGDQISDLAILKINGTGFKKAEFGDSTQIFCGENVVSIGRPGDAEKPSSITKGIISATAIRVRTTSNYSAKLIQTDSPINVGSSGGALVNMYGQVVGITSSKLVNASYDSVNYAITTRTMKRVCDELIKEKKVVSRAKIGITYTAINSITAEIAGYDKVGLYIASVSEDSDLYGKVEKGDIITHISGIAVTSDDIVLDIIEEKKAGDKITFTVSTKSGEKTVEAELKANIGQSSYSATIKGENNSSASGGTFDFPDGD